MSLLPSVTGCVVTCKEFITTKSNNMVQDNPVIFCRISPNKQNKKNRGYIPYTHIKVHGSVLKS